LGNTLGSRHHFRGISDKRKFTNFTENDGKTLVLTGTVIFGGIEIKSY